MAKGVAGGVFLTTDDCQASYEELSARGVEFTETPEQRPYGIDCRLPRPLRQQPAADPGDDARRRLSERRGGGDGRYWARTSDLYLVEVALSQLS